MKTNISEFRADYEEYICGIFLSNTKFKFYREYLNEDGEYDEFSDIDCYFSESMFDDGRYINELMYHKNNLEKLSDVVESVWNNYKKMGYYNEYIYNMIEAEIKNDLTIFLTFILESNDDREMCLGINVKYIEGR